MARLSREYSADSNEQDAKIRLRDQEMMAMAKHFESLQVRRSFRAEVLRCLQGRRAHPLAACAAAKLCCAAWETLALTLAPPTLQEDISSTEQALVEKIEEARRVAEEERAARKELAREQKKVDLIMKSFAAETDASNKWQAKISVARVTALGDGASTSGGSVGHEQAARGT
jgi:hypothetical protein